MPRKSLLWGVMLSIMLILLPGLSTPAHRSVSSIKMVPGTVPLSESLQAAVQSALQTSPEAQAAAGAFAPTALEQKNGWYFVSIAGLKSAVPEPDWNILDDVSWIGLVLAQERPDGSWDSAVEGSDAYSRMLAAIPSTLLDGEAKRGLDPEPQRTGVAATYRFPWPAGTKMMYGAYGVHDAGFVSVVGSGWKAVDFVSDADTNRGHAPNLLLAAADGAISYVCNDGTSVAVRIGDLLYVHLLDNANLRTGRSFAQGAELGTLRPGTFSNRCGWGNLDPEWFHVHWAFRNTGTLQVEDWTLDVADGRWRYEEQVLGPGSWLLAGDGDVTPPDGDYTEPWVGAVVTRSVQLAGWATDAESGFQKARFIARWGDAWENIGPDLTQSPFSYEWDLCASGVPDGPIQLGLDLWDEAGNVAYTPQGIMQITKDFDCAEVLRPETPPLESPLQASTQPFDAILRFAWQDVSLANAYQVEWWGGPYTNTQPLGWIGSNWYEIGEVEPGYTYSWRVRARNDAGASAWSETRSTSIFPLQLTAPLTISPTQPLAGRAVTAEFRVKNSSALTVTLPALGVRTSGGDCGPDLPCPSADDFPPSEDVTLQPGEAYRYLGTRRFAGAEDAYTLDIVYQETGGLFPFPGTRPLTVTVAVSAGSTTYLPAVMRDE